MSETPLLNELADGVLVLTLNRPQSLNALSSALRRALIEALNRASEDPAVRAVILTGSGRAFCAGIDLKEIAASGHSVDDNVDAENVADAISGCRKPVIGAINGLAITGGFEISLACDILIASESARFADTHVRVGINPGWGLSQRLSRAIGPYRAKELSLTGSFMPAAQALEWGLVNHVVPDCELLDLARRLAGEIAANDPEHVARMKAVMDEGFAMPLGEALVMEAERAGQLNRGVSPESVEQGRVRAQAKARQSQ